MIVNALSGACLAALTLLWLISNSCAKDKLKLYTDLDTPELVRKYGYSAETHELTTEDKYIIALHRVFSERTVNTPVLVAQGIVAGSTDWVCLGPNRSLGLILADEGYDVWLMNFRGNVYSRKHKNIDPVTEDNREYWDFSFDEMATLDLPAAINYILNLTDEKALNYVGLSMGTTTFFAMCSVMPQIQSKINLMISFAPVISTTHMRGIVGATVKVFPQMDSFLNDGLHTYEVAPNYDWLKKIGAPECRGKLPFLNQQLCALFFFEMAGFNSEGFDVSTLDAILGRYPAGTSSKTFLHFSQMYTSGKFSMFDYGESLNMEKYNRFHPPEYNLTGINVPILVAWSDNDFISSVENAEILRKKLPNIVSFRKQPKFNHLDYIWGYRVNKRLYDYVLKLLKQYSN